MAELQMTVFRDATITALGDVLQEEKITVTGTSAQTSVLAGTKADRFVRIFADVDSYVTWGTNPTALTDGSDGRMIGAGNPEYFQIPAGYKVAAILR